MKVLNFSRYLLSLFILFFFTAPILSQEKPKDELVYIHEEVAKISKIDQYNSTSKEFSQMMMDSKLDVPWIRASETDDLHFYYLVPLKNYGDIDKMSAAFNDMMSKMGKDKVDKLMSENAESIASVRELVFKRSGSLSYAGQDQGLDWSKSNFIHWDYYTVKSGKMKDMLVLGAKYKKMCEDKKVPTPYTVWLSEMGTDDNLIVITTVAKDAVSFYQQMEKDNATMGKDAEDIWNQMMPLLDHFEHKNGHSRPDLSYMKSE